MVEKDNEKNKDEKRKEDATGSKNSGKLWPAVSAVLFILLVVSILWTPAPSSVASMTKDEVSAKAQSLVEKDLNGAATVKIANVTEEKGLYKLAVVLSAGGKDAVFESYATKDGKLFFAQSIKMDEALNAPDLPDTPPESPQVPVKADKPTIQLFVMSQCPYGVQAENALKPVLDTLKGKVKFELKFIANKNADGTFSSLHGKAEVDENLRQVCAMNVYPNYMDYVICRNANIRSTDWESCATKNGMSATVIKACAEGNEGEGLLAKNIELANTLGVGGSPTMLVNSQAYQGGRTPDAFQSYICNSFTTPPAECGTAIISNQSANEVPAGGCGV